MKLPLVLVYFALAAFACKAAPSTEQGPKSVAAIAPSAVPSSPRSDEVLVLRAQLAEAQRFQEQILTTVYWSLGTLAGVAVLLVGFGWWTNFRVYERDKQSLERELRTLLVESSAQARDEQKKASADQYAALRQQLESALSAGETRLSTTFTTLSEASEKRLAAQVAQVRSTYTTLRDQVRELHLSAHVRERLEERASKSYRNALQTTVTALELANEIGEDYSVGNILDLVTEDMNTILSGNDLPIDNFLVGQLIDALNAVKGSHAHAAAALKSKASRLVSA